MKIKSIFLILFLFINSAFGQGMSTEAFINELRDNEELSVFDAPMISIFRSECPNINQAPPLSGKLKFMCNIVNSSRICKKLKPEDRINCNNVNDSRQFDVIDFFAGCTTGLFDSVTQLISFVWKVVKWVGSKVSGANQSKTSSNYINSVKLYLVNEYDKAYDEASNPFRKVKAAKIVSEAIGKKLYDAIQSYLYTNYRRYGCMNFKARTKTICKVAGDFLLPPIAALGLLKKGAKAFKASKNLKAFMAGQRHNVKKLKSFKRKKFGESSLGRKITEDQMMALEKAHKIGQWKKRGEFTQKEIRTKVKVLKTAGFSAQEIRSLAADGVLSLSSQSYVKVVKVLVESGELVLDKLALNSKKLKYIDSALESAKDATTINNILKHDKEVKKQNKKIEADDIRASNYYNEL